MSKMYYAEMPDAAHDIHDLNVALLGQGFHFYTDAGVFSKKMVDYGSQVLLNALDLERGKNLLDVGCGYGPQVLLQSENQQLVAFCNYFFKEPSLRRRLIW